MLREPLCWHHGVKITGVDYLSASRVLKWSIEYDSALYHGCFIVFLPSKLNSCQATFDLSTTKGAACNGSRWFVSKGVRTIHNMFYASIWSPAPRILIFDSAVAESGSEVFDEEILQWVGRCLKHFFNIFIVILMP